MTFLDRYRTHRADAANRAAIRDGHGLVSLPHAAPRPRPVVPLFPPMLPQQVHIRPDDLALLGRRFALRKTDLDELGAAAVAVLVVFARKEKRWPR